MTKTKIIREPNYEFNPLIWKEISGNLKLCIIIIQKKNISVFNNFLLSKGIKKIKIKEKVRNVFSF